MPEGMGKHSYGKPWGSLTKKPGSEYQQVDTGESHSDVSGSKFVPGGRSEEYATNTSGESHSSVKGSKFCGPTKGNRDLPPNHTSGVAEGQYKGT